MMLPQYQQGFEMAKDFAARELAARELRKKNNENTQKSVNRAIRKASASLSSVKSTTSSISNSESVCSNIPQRSESFLVSSPHYFASSLLLSSSCSIPHDVQEQPASPPQGREELQNLLQHTMLTPLQIKLDELAQQTQNCKRSLEVHTERACGRFMAQNELGAILSLRRIKRAQYELEALQQAREYLQSQQQEWRQAKDMASPAELRQLVTAGMSRCMEQLGSILQQSSLSFYSPSAAASCRSSGGCFVSIPSLKSDGTMTSEGQSNCSIHDDDNDKDDKDFTVVTVDETCSIATEDHHHHHASWTDEELLKEFTRSLLLPASSATRMTAS